MKKLKYAFWLILIGFFGVIIYQNWDYLTVQNNLKLNLVIYNEPIPALTNGAIIAICVGTSVLVMLMFYFASKYEAYRAKKTIKELSRGIEESRNNISALQQQLEMLKAGTQPPATDAPEQDENQAPDTETSQASQI